MNLKRMTGILFLVLAGGYIFASRFGLHILNPSRYAWLRYPSSDRYYDFLHWLYYKSSPVSFPFGIIQGFGFPQEVPIMYTSAIPLIAIPAKGLDFLFGAAEWQPFGWWMLLSWCLQGLLGYRLLHLLGIKNFWFRILGTAFFWFMPCLLMRFNHMSLCGHWLILAGLVLYFSRRLEIRHKLLGWYGLSVVALLVHPYFILFLAAQGVAIVWSGLRTHSLSWTYAGLWSLGYLASMAITLYVFGYFLLPSDSYVEWGYGHFSANLNTLFNNMGHSRAPLNFPNYTVGQYEGYGYLGLGILALTGVTLVISALKPSEVKHSVKTHLPILTITILLFLFSLSNVVSFNQAHIVVPVPDVWVKLASLFRSTGRFVWMADYVLLGIGLWSLYQLPIRAGWRLSLLILLLGVQFWDLGPMLTGVYPSIEAEDRMPFPRQPVQDAMQQAERVITYPPYSRTMERHDDITDLIFWAAQQHKPITAGHLPRFNRPLRQATTDSIASCLSDGQFERFDRTLWVYSKTTAPLFAAHPDLTIFRAGNYYFGFPPDVPVPMSFRESDRLEEDRTRYIHLADFLEETDFTYLLIAAQDEASQELDEKARDYFSRLGSAVKTLEFRGSWAALFSSDSLMKEQVRGRYDGPASLKATIGAGPTGVQKTIHIRSAGMDAGNFSSIEIGDGKNYTAEKRGLHLLLLDRNLEPLQYVNLDTYLSSLMAMTDQ